MLGHSEKGVEEESEVLGPICSQEVESRTEAEVESLDQYP